VGVVTTGRFHVLDLARELHDLGHDVQFYSYLPLSRCIEHGLPEECYRALSRSLWPVVAARHLAPTRFQNRLVVVANSLLDLVAAQRVEACDTLIGMSGIAIKAAETARRNYSATVFIERASEHIFSQRETLLSMPAGRRSCITCAEVDRELRSYAAADVITVPSHHVEASFVELGTAREKLFRNPFGVDLAVFAPTAVPSSLSPTVIFAGLWCYEKGCDLLWEACRRASGKWRLLHVGEVGDAQLPRSSSFEHIDAVRQNELPRFYARAHVAVLASRQDGYGMVLNQAAACGLPIVCTDKTGGRDLQELIGGSKFVHVVPAGDVEALNAAIDDALNRAQTQISPRDYLGAGRKKISWRAYGQRYSVELERRRGTPARATSET